MKMKKLMLIVAILFTGCITNNADEVETVKAHGVIIKRSAWFEYTDIMCDDGYSVRVRGRYFGDEGDSVKVIAKIY